MSEVSFGPDYIYIVSEMHDDYVREPIGVYYTEEEAVEAARIYISTKASKWLDGIEVGELITGELVKDMRTIGTWTGEYILGADATADTVPTLSYVFTKELGR